MLRRYSELVGLPIVTLSSETDEGEAVKPFRLGRVYDLILDPDRGTLIALLTIPRGAISVNDLLPFKGEQWQVRDPDAIIDAEELIRLQSIDPARRHLLGKSVVTESGETLGKALDYGLDMKSLTLKELSIGRTFLFFVIEERVISAKQIVKIEKDKIVVKNGTEKARETEKLKETFPLKQKVTAPATMATREE